MNDLRGGGTAGSAEDWVCFFRAMAGPAETVSKLGGEKNILSKTRLETIFPLRSIAATSPKKHRIFVLLSFETVSAVPPHPKIQRLLASSRRPSLVFSHPHFATPSKPC